MRAAPLALFAVLLALVPSPARGDDPPPAIDRPHIAIRLSYNLGPGTKSCPPEQVLHDEVARRMGYDPFTPDAADRVVTTLSLSPRASTATVQFYDTGDHRWDDETFTVPDHNCMAAVTGVAIYLSYMFAPFIVPPKAAPIPPTPEPPPPPPTEAPTPPPARAPASSTPMPASPPPTPLSSARRRSWLVELGGGPFVAFGIAPGVAIGGALHVGLHLPSIPLSIALEGRADLPASAAVEGSPHAHLQTNLVGGSVIPCWGPHTLGLLCGVATVGRVSGEISGISNPKVGRAVYLGTGLRAGLEAQVIDHVKGRVFGDMLVTVVPAQANLAGGDVWHTPLVSGDLGAALLAFF